MFDEFKRQDTEGGKRAERQPHNAPQRGAGPVPAGDMVDPVHDVDPPFAVYPLLVALCHTTSPKYVAARETNNVESRDMA